MKDIHSVSSLLKMYFRELPNPVCTFSLYDRFVSAVQSTDEDDERSCELRKVLGSLPKPNHRTLASLIRHLHRVSLHSDSTGMTAKNLAIVWAPNLLRYFFIALMRDDIHFHSSGAELWKRVDLVFLQESVFRLVKNVRQASLINNKKQA